MALPMYLQFFIVLTMVSIANMFRRLKIKLGLATERYGMYNPFEYRGMWFSPVVHSMERVKECEIYDNFRPDDVVICTYAKSGTHFVSEIILSMYKQLGLVPQHFTHTEGSASLEITRPAHMSKPTKGRDEGAMIGIEAPQSPRIIPTHLLWNILPPAIKEGKVKTIHCSRNPKDVICSMLPFYKKVGILFPDVTWNDFVQWNIEGNVVGGSYFQHLSEWYPNRNNNNVLSLRFEDMKKDLKGNVKKIAEFLNIELTNEQLEAVVQANTFENMKKERGSNNPIYRKGKSGGWKSTFTVEQSEMLDEWIQQEMKGLEDVMI